MFVSKCLCKWVGVVAKANPLDFPVFSHLISSKWLFFVFLSKVLSDV